MADAHPASSIKASSRDFVLQVRALAPVHTTFCCDARSSHEALALFEQAHRAGRLQWFVGDELGKSDDAHQPPIPGDRVAAISRISPTAHAGVAASSNQPFKVQALGFAQATQTVWLEADDQAMARKVGEVFAGMRPHPWTIGGQTVVLHIPRSAVIAVEPFA